MCVCVEITKTHAQVQKKPKSLAVERERVSRTKPQKLTRFKYI